MYREVRHKYCRESACESSVAVRLKHKERRISFLSKATLRERGKEHIYAQAPANVLHGPETRVVLDSKH